MGHGLLDVSGGDDAHNAQRLTEEFVVWFGSTRTDGRPHHVGKYGPLLGSSGFPAWRATLSQPILVTVTRLTAWTRRDGRLAYRSVP